MRNINLILLSICLLLSCTGNKAASFYTAVNKIYSEANDKIYSFLIGKEKSEEKVASFLADKISDLKAIPEFDDGNNLRRAMENEITLWKETFGLSYKINHTTLSEAAKNTLIMKRLDLQAERNPLNQVVEKENNLFVEKFNLKSFNTVTKIKFHQ